MAAPQAPPSSGFPIIPTHIAFLLFCSLALLVLPIHGDKELCAETCGRTRDPQLCMESIGPNDFDMIKTLFDLQCHMIGVGKTKSANLSEQFQRLRKKQLKKPQKYSNAILACEQLTENSLLVYDQALADVKQKHYPGAKMSVMQVMDNAERCQSLWAEAEKSNKDAPFFNPTVNWMRNAGVILDLLKLSDPDQE